MRIKTVILILMLTPMIMKSQNATATLGNIISCPGQSVLVPMDVTGFFEVGAMTFFIGFDTNAVAFLSVENINPAIPSWIIANANNGQIALAYSSMTPFDIDGEKLFDLSFSYLSDSTDLIFLSGTEIANINLEVIPLDTYSGGINNSIQIVDQPDNVQAYPDNDVSFNLTVVGTTDFQWQENSGSGWTDLQNNSTYSGVTTNTLFIHDVTLDFNGNNYRCEVTADECTVISDTALLEVAEAYPVASLGFLSSCPDIIIYEPLSVGDFFDVIEFTFNISFNPGSISFVDLTNINPDILSGTLTTMPITTPPGVSIHWEDSEPVSITTGKLFDLIFDYSSGSQAVTFETGSTVINSSSNPIDITFNDGGVEPFAVPVIIDQPDNDTVNEFESAAFTTEVTGADNYRWMVSTDEGLSWSDLRNTPPYFNVNTGTLSINPVAYSFNGNLYKCRVNNTECMVYSDAALLTVDTLTIIKEQTEKLNINIFPVPFINVIQISLSSNGIIDHVNVFNAQGNLMDSYIIKMEVRKGPINIDLSSLIEGVYFIEIVGEINGRSAFETKKIIKIK